MQTNTESKQQMHQQRVSASSKPTDQTSGDLLPFIEQLLPHFPANGATMPINELLNHLQKEAPNVFIALDRFIATAKMVCKVDEQMALQWKNKGNQEFTRRALPESLISYTHALLCAERDETIAILLNNRSTVFYEMHRYADACVDADYALQYNPHYLKALQRRGRSLEQLGLTELGAHDVQASLYTDSIHLGNSREVMERVLREVITGYADRALPPRVKILKTLEILHLHEELLSDSNPNSSSRSSSSSNIHKIQKGVIASASIAPGTVLEEHPYALIARMESLLTACAYCLQYTQCLYHGEDYRHAKCKSRGFFCSKACAHASWEQYGKYEQNNPFYLCCPNDALLASRLVRAEDKYASLTSFCTVNAFSENNDNINVDEDDKSSNNEGSKENEMHEESSNDTITTDDKCIALGASLLRSLDDNISREFCTKNGKTNSGTNSNNNETSEYSVGGAESIVMAIGLYMNAFDTVEHAERVRQALRQILTHGCDITCLLQMSANTTEIQRGQSDVHGKDDLSNNTIHCKERFIAHSNTTVSLGKAMYSVINLFNHSCDPNCYISFWGNPQSSSAQLVLRAIRPIAPHEELTISYHNINRFTTHSTRHRQFLLQTQCGITHCACDWCRLHPDEVICESDKEYYVKAADYYQKGKRMIQERDYQTALTVLWQSYEMVMRFICPPPRPPQMMLPKTHNALALAYFYTHNTSKCVEHLEAEREVDIAIHETDVRPEMININTRLAFMCNDTAKKRTYAERAVELLQLFYSHSPSLDLQITYTRSSYDTKKVEEEREMNSLEQFIYQP